MAKKVTPAVAILPGQCSDAECRGELQPIDDHKRAITVDISKCKDAHAWRCQRCGVEYPAHIDRELVRCPNDGTALVFDTTIVGKTCGGLQLRGWNRCDHCGSSWLSRRGVPDAGGGSDGRWCLSAGGRSLDAGGIRLRPEGKASKEDVVTLMARISRMPAFEAALERIASGDLDADAMRKLAADALAIADGADEVDA